MTNGPVTTHLNAATDPTVDRIAKTIHAACRPSRCSDWELHRHVAMRLVNEFTPDGVKYRISQAHTQGVLAGRYAEQRMQGVKA